MHGPPCSISLELLNNTSVDIVTNTWFTEGRDKAGGHGMPS